MAMSGKQIIESIAIVTGVVIMVVVAALIIGTLLGNTIFSDLTIINTSDIAEAFGLFVTGLIAFLAIIGTIVGVVWLVFYVKMLFDKKTGIQNMTA